MDVNQHVNNVRYIGWILEVVYSGQPDTALQLKPPLNDMMQFFFRVYMNYDAVLTAGDLNAECAAGRAGRLPPDEHHAGLPPGVPSVAAARVAHQHDLVSACRAAATAAVAVEPVQLRPAQHAPDTAAG